MNGRAAAGAILGLSQVAGRRKPQCAPMLRVRATCLLGATRCCVRLFGPHGAGYLYVRQDLQGSVIEDRLFAGNAWANYEPWLDETDAAIAAIATSPARTDASRYQPGHSGYLAYAALSEGLAFIEQVGVQQLQAHSVALNRRLLDQLDARRFPCIRRPVL